MRDKEVEAIFVTADDAIQGLWALHNYINAAVKVADRDRMKRLLPTESFQMTHEWTRRYDEDELVMEMENAFEFIHCRNSLVLLVSIFEGAIDLFNKRLAAGDHSSRVEGYRKLLNWTFTLLKASTAGSQSMRQRLPSDCGDVDNARRLRNCFAHNNGRYDENYLRDAVNDGWVEVRHLRGAATGVSAREKIFVINGNLEELLRSHIELRHMLYNTIQRTYFGETEDYNYAKEGKGIEWHRIVSGQTFVGM